MREFMNTRNEMTGEIRIARKKSFLEENNII